MNEVEEYESMCNDIYEGETWDIMVELLLNKDQEIERLNNIINELEEEISRHIALCTDVTLNDILDKLKKLKENCKQID